jgi:hypothetical protein
MKGARKKFKVVQDQDGVAERGGVWVGGDGDDLDQVLDLVRLLVSVSCQYFCLHAQMHGCMDA